MNIGEPLQRPVVIHGTYEPKEGQAMPSMGYSIEDMASLYQPCEAEARAHVDRYFQSGETEYFPFAPRSAEEAREAVRRFVFPEALRQRAQREAGKLAWLLVEHQGPRLRRRQAEGRFDPRAAGRVLQAVRSNTYSAEAARPFQRQHRESPRRPHVAIVAAGNWSAMWGDGEYIPNIGVLSSAVSWATETLGCACTSVIARQIRSHNGDVPQLALVYVARPGRPMPLKAFAAVLHRDMYRGGLTALDVAHPYHVQVKKGLSCEAEARRRIRADATQEVADEEFKGVAWARQQGATVVVSVGEFDDAEDADVALGHRCHRAPAR